MRDGPADLRWCLAANPGPLTLDGTCSYLVGSSPAVLVDPGPAGDDQVRRLLRLAGGRAVGVICLTHAHADHAGCATEAARVFGAPIAASRDTHRRLGTDGTRLADGDSIEFDGGRSRLDVVETPGHSADHICFFWDETGVIFTGDLVLGEGTSAILHPDGHMGRYFDSLQRLRTLEPARLMPGHGEPVDDPAARIDAILRHRRGREREIESAIAAGERTVEGIRRRVYGALGAGLEAAAEACVRAHLVHLRERGVSVPSVDDPDSDPRRGGRG